MKLYMKSKKYSRSKTFHDDGLGRPAMSPEEALEAVNPKWETDEYGWTNNCLHAALAYEACRRGILCEAVPYQPLRFMGTYSHGMDRVLEGYRSVDVGSRSRKRVLENIRVQAAEWGDGTRGFVELTYRYRDGHIFNFEQIEGRTRFFDAQSGREVEDAYLFDEEVMPTRTAVGRADDLDFYTEIYRYVDSKGMYCSAVPTEEERRCRLQRCTSSPSGRSCSELSKARAAWKKEREKKGRDAYLRPDLMFPW